jgi:cobalt-zinc-cadmium efflux system membrane fusion protein
VKTAGIQTPHPFLSEHTVKNKFILTLGAFAIALLAGCNEAAPPAPEVPAPILQGNQLRFAPGHPQLALLGVTSAAPGKAIVVELPAKLVWNEERTQRIYPAFAGRVTAIKADVGQAVKPGTLLAQIASPDFGIAQADAAKAQADSRLTQKSLQRQRELFEAGIVARKDLDGAEADAARSQAEIQRAQARTRLYGGGGSVNQQLALTAGINGVVVERNLNPGQEVRPDQSGPGAPPLFVVTDPTSLWVQIDARESEIATLKPGSLFELTIPTLPGQKFQGRVLAASDFIDPATRTIKVRGVVANPDRMLKAEMLATARIDRIIGKGVVIPSQAVSLQGTKHTVMVQVQPGVFETREVKLAYQGPRETVVSLGLEAGEQVVTENTLLLAREFRSAEDDARPPTAMDKKTPAALENQASAAIKPTAPKVAPASAARSAP